MYKWILSYMAYKVNLSIRIILLTTLRFLWIDNNVKALQLRILFNPSRKGKWLYIWQPPSSISIHLSAEALEIPPHIINPHYLSTAINRLAMINIYKTPKDKMYTFINAVTILSLMPRSILIKTQHQVLKRYFRY